MSGKLATLAAAILITILSNVKAYAVDLTGYWKANDQGTYYMRQIGSVLWWYGSLVDSVTHATVFSNVARGTISGKQIKLTWADVPPGPNRNNGILVLKIVSDIQLVATKRTGNFGGFSWRAAAPCCPCCRRRRAGHSRSPGPRRAAGRWRRRRRTGRAAARSPRAGGRPP